jgi:hypothetical protein
MPPPNQKRKPQLKKKNKKIKFMRGRNEKTD